MTSVRQTALRGLKDSMMEVVMRTDPDAQAMQKQIAAYKTLVASLEARLANHEQQASKYRESIATLESERQANVILTAELAALRERLADSAGAMAVGYCEACQSVGMSNCGNFDECDGARCITCKRLFAVATKPVLYQYRMRPAWQSEGWGWTPWKDCEEGAYSDYESTPILNDWHYEARKLFAAPPTHTAAVQAALEAAAKVCLDLIAPPRVGGVANAVLYHDATDDCAAAIRAIKPEDVLGGGKA
jgi:hypothetical protein